MNYTLEDLGFKGSFVGLEVVIHPRSIYYARGERSNPTGILGIVRGLTDEPGWHHVYWKTGVENTYKVEDLMIDPSIEITREYLYHLDMLYGIDVKKAEELYGF